MLISKEKNRILVNKRINNPNNSNNNNNNNEKWCVKNLREVVFDNYNYKYIKLF